MKNRFQDLADLSFNLGVETFKNELFKATLGGRQIGFEDVDRIAKTVKSPHKKEKAKKVTRK